MKYKSASLSATAYSGRFPLFLRIGLERGNAPAALWPEKVDAVRRIDGVVVELALPRALAGGPAESAVLERLPLLVSGLFVKKQLQPVFPLVDFRPAAGKFPARELRTVFQVVDALLYPVNIGIVIREIKGRVGFLCQSRDMDA